MHFDFVDIGTSDFDTCLDSLSNSSERSKFLLVEPLKFYLDKLPDSPNVYKENAAVSNVSGTSVINFLPPDIIKRYRLAWWLRGCSRIDERHPLVDEELSKKKLPLQMVEKIKCNVITFDDLCHKYEIESIGSLKIDTEGHEEYILPDVLEKVKSGFRISKIKYENQMYIGNYDLLNKIAESFIDIGYELVKKTHMDIELQIRKK